MTGEPADDQPPAKPSYDELEGAMLSMEEMLGRVDHLKTFSLFQGNGILRIEYNDRRDTWTVSFPDRRDRTVPIVKGPGQDLWGVISQTWQACYDRQHKPGSAG